MFAGRRLLGSELFVTLSLILGSAGPGHAEVAACSIAIASWHGYSKPAPKLCLAADMASIDRAGPECTNEQMECDPALVEGPCTERLAETALSAKERATALYIRGRAYNQTGRPSLAAKDYDAALVLDPDNADVHVSLGWLNFSTDDFESAITEAHTAFRLDPNNARALDLLGFLHQKAGKTTIALEEYSQALENDASTALARLHRATLLYDLDRPQEALPDANLLVDLGPDAANRVGLLYLASMTRVDFHAWVLLLRARILENLKNYGEAEKDYSAALARNRSIDALTDFGAMLKRWPARRQEAKGYLREAIALKPSFYLAHCYYGDALSADGLLEQAVDEYTTSIKLAPGFARAHFWRGKTLKRLGRTDDAAHDFEVAMWIDDYFFKIVVENLRMSGYWTRQEDPQTDSRDLRDSLIACTIDTRCL